MVSFRRFFFQKLTIIESAYNSGYIVGQAAKGRFIEIYGSIMH
jgi:hypothetical protein